MTMEGVRDFEQTQYKSWKTGDSYDMFSRFTIGGNGKISGQTHRLALNLNENVTIKPDHKQSLTSLQPTENGHGLLISTIFLTLGFLALVIIVISAMYCLRKRSKSAEVVIGAENSADLEKTQEP